MRHKAALSKHVDPVDRTAYLHALTEDYVHFCYKINEVHEELLSDHDRGRSLRTPYHPESRIYWRYDDSDLRLFATGGHDPMTDLETVNSLREEQRRTAWNRDYCLEGTTATNGTNGDATTSWKGLYRPQNCSNERVNTVQIEEIVDATNVRDANTTVPAHRSLKRSPLSQVREIVERKVRIYLLDTGSMTHLSATPLEQAWVRPGEVNTTLSGIGDDSILVDQVGTGYAFTCTKNVDRYRMILKDIKYSKAAKTKEHILSVGRLSEGGWKFALDSHGVHGDHHGIDPDGGKHPVVYNNRNYYMPLEIDDENAFRIETVTPTDRYLER